MPPARGQIPSPELVLRSDRGTPGDVQGRRRRSGLGGEFRRLLAAVGVSGVGDGMRQTAFPLLTASVTRSPLAVAAVGVAQGLPWLLFSLPIGALVDRWDRRRVVLAVNTLRAVLVARFGRSGRS